MFRRESGITLVTLTITIIVLIILASVTTYTGANTIKNARYYNAVAELKAMKTKVDELYEEYQNGDETVKSAILNQGTDTSAKEAELSTAYYVASQNNTNGTDLGLSEDYRYYSQEYITDTLDVDGIDRDFFINIKARSVLLVDGIEYQNETYYALCQIEGEQFSVNYIPTYKIYFDANGGTVNQLSKLVSYGETYGELPTPTRDGYTFLGWTYGNEFDPQAFYDIGKDYGVAIDGNDIILSTYGYQENVTKCPVNCEEKKSYILSYDWYVPSAPYGAKCSSGLAITYTDNDFQRNWLEGKGEGESGSFQFVSNNQKTIGHISSSGWKYNGTMRFSNIRLSELIQSNTNVKQTTSHILQAQWKNISVKLTFDKQGGNFGDGTTGNKWTSTSKNFTYLTSYKSITQVPYYISDTNFAIYKDGYTLDGWYTAAEGGTKLFDANGRLIPSVDGYSDENRTWLFYDRDITIYAHWTPNS